MSQKSELQKRQRALLDLTIEAGKHRYDPEMGLCADYTEHMDKTRTGKYGGHYVAWMSPPYAEALLATDKDVKLAAKIIERICDFQELDPGLPYYGNYYGVAEWNGVGDQNAVSFLTTALGYMWLEYGDKLPKRTRDKLYKSLDIASVGLIRRRADVFYTNIYLLCIVGKLFLGRILDRPDLLELAETEFNCYLDTVSRENNSEYNSPTYSSVQIECLLLVRDFPANSKMKKRAEAALEYLLTVYALHYHRPSRIHSGTLSRAYRETLISHFDGTNFMAHTFFGEPLHITPDPTTGRNRSFAGIHWTRSDYIPPRHVQDLFHNKTFPVHIEEQNVSYWGRDNDPKIIERASFQNETWSLATQYGVWASYGHFLPFQLTWASEDARRRSLFIQNEPETALIDSWFRQTEDTAAGAFFWKMHGYKETAFWKKTPPFLSHQICHLGATDEVELFVNGRKWNGRSNPRAGTTLTVVSPDIEYRIRFLEPPEGVRLPKMNFDEEHGDHVIRLVYAESETPEKFYNAAPCLCPLVIEVRPGGKGSEWKEKKVRTSRKGDFWKITTGKLSTLVPLTLEARDQLAEASNPPLQDNLIESEHYTTDTATLRKKFGLGQA